MFYANLGVKNWKASNYVMNREVMINIECLHKLLNMDRNVDFKVSKDLEDYSKDEAIKFPFLDNLWNVATGKIMIIRSSIKDRLLHLTILKCITLRVSNTTNMIEK